MKNIYYGITSYHRPECITLNMLLKMGIPKERIIITLNDPNDYDTYMKLYGDTCKVILRAGDNDSFNRNTVLNSFKTGDRVCLLDDDLISIKKLVPKNNKVGFGFRKIETRAELEAMLDECFNECEKVGSRFFGFYQVSNNGWMKNAIDKDGIWSNKKLFQGGFWGFINSDLRFDESYFLQGDYEIILRQIVEDRNIIRRNDVVAEKKPNAITEGGCNDLYRQGVQQKMQDKLMEQYPGMVYADKKRGRTRLRRRA